MSEKPYDFKSIEDVDYLAIERPDEYDRLLRGYFRLLGTKPKIWWQDDGDMVDEHWPRFVRDAIMQLAEASGIPPRTLSNWLDDEALPRARAKVLEIARNHRA